MTDPFWRDLTKPPCTPEELRAEDEQKALTVYRLVREIANNNSPADSRKILFSRKTGTNIPGSGYLQDYLPKGSTP